MQKDEDFQKVVARFEAVEWLYDGLNGKIIPWTHDQGNENEDPSILVFVAKPDGTVIDRAPNAYAASPLSKWLDDAADKYERDHPKTRVPLARATVVGEGEGEERTVSCEQLDAAREDDKPVLVYVGRSEGADDNKKARLEVKASRKFEKGTLGSKGAATAAEGWALLRLDLQNADHALLARDLGVERVPTLLVLLPGEEKPRDLGGKITGNALAHQLKKLKPASDDE